MNNEDKKNRELVLSVKKEKIGFINQGFIPEKKLSFLKEQDCFFISRTEVEENPQFVQIIPYVLLNTKDGSLLIFQRSKMNGDTRLLGKKTVGVGGHINTQDIRNDKQGLLDLKSTLYATLKRELKEEVNIICKDNSALKQIGLISTNIEPIDNFHFGIVFTYLISTTEKIITPDQELSVICAENFLLIALRFKKLESWTEITVRYLAQHPEIILS